MRSSIIYVIALAMLTSCGSDDPNEIITPDNGSGNETPSSGSGSETPSSGTSQSSYTELYRPQLHYTPARNWVNDPNGMVYQDGTWHLFYQYNPYGNSWGNMSWGHATSTDLVHWSEKSVALTRDDLGDIFSGSAVIDKDNTSGLGANAIIALYTSSGTHQQQSLAYSTDGGTTFQKFAGNPVVANTTRNDFRDPKVFWHEGTKRWVMCLALGYEYGVQLLTSTDLRTWREASTFTTDVQRCKRGQWECPDLFPLTYTDGTTKWVLVVSVNPGGPTSGSGTMYFIGDFDGEKFVADETLSYPLWLDYGMDNYAGVTWSNAPDDRRILLGWMNNWLYSGDVPCDPWRSAFTLPRELSLVTYQGKPLLASRPVAEFDKLASQWQTPSSADGLMTLPTQTSTLHVQVTLSASTANVITLANGSGESMAFTYSPSAGSLIAKRNSSTGAATFNGSFSLPSITASLCNEAEQLTLDFYIDQSSVEVFTANGSMAMTNLVFPTGGIYNHVTLSSSAQTLRYRTFNSIWQ